MPIVFEEISGEIAPQRGAETPTQHEAPAPAENFDPAELLRRELQRAREREHRLIAD